MEVEAEARRLSRVQNHCYEAETENDARFMATRPKC